MSLTQSAWTEDSVNGFLVLECNVIQTASESDSYTLKTPARTLDPTKPWILMVNTTGATLDNATLPVDIWAGYDDDFAMSGDTTAVIATSGGEVASAVMDDVKAEMLTTIVDPNYTGTMVAAATNTVGIVNAGTAPYYAIAIDGGTLIAETCYFKIIQRQ